ncbi:MAG TPA: galactosyltransferase-related protein [Pseudobdellovibrionaceae bacterium]|nr:galactosyltransferase-related protein [Pseudobdellovibrionaceae bacterium]
MSAASSLKPSRYARVILPTHCEVHRSVTCPEVLSSWRSRSLTEAEIVAQVAREIQLRSGDRKSEVEIVLTPGHLLRSDAAEIWRTLLSNFPNLRLRQLLHWTQALSLKRQGENWRRDFPHLKFEIAIDAKLSRVSLDLLRQTWNCDWLIIPRPDWHADVSLSAFVEIERQSQAHASTAIELTLLCPRPNHHEGPFLDNDELQLFLDEARDAFPDVHFQSAPPDYFVSSELGTLARDASREVWPSRTPQPQHAIELSIICPVKSLNFPEVLKRLRILRDQSPFSTELIIVRDDGGTLTPHGDEIWLQMPESQRENDWRAGSVRNLGARAASGQHLLFVDADVRLPLEALKEIAAAWSLQPRLNAAHKAGAWWSASSSCWILPRHEFWSVGGFAEAFSTYGCEDAELAFRLQAQGFSTDPLPFSITHLRPESADDSGLLKMLKLKTAAQLLHRMTLSAETHFIFYSVMGSTQSYSATLRAAAKRLWDWPLVGWLLKAGTELMTLFESREKAKFIRGWLQHFLWVFKGPLLLLVSESWRVRIFGDVARLHAWKLPHALAWPIHQIRSAYGNLAGPLSRGLIAVKAAIVSKSWLVPHFVKWPFYILSRGLGQIAGPIHAAHIRIWTSYFGLRPFLGWTWSKRHWPGVLATRTQGHLKKLATQIYWAVYAGVQFFKRGVDQASWRMKVFALRTAGCLKALAWKFVLHPAWEFGGLVYAGVVRYLFAPIWANRWLLQEPTAWFALHCPNFHRLIWRRLLKLRYFLAYQWQSRISHRIRRKTRGHENSGAGT